MTIFGGKPGMKQMRFEIDGWLHECMQIAAIQEKKGLYQWMQDALRMELDRQAARDPVVWEAVHSATKRGGDET